MTMQSRCEETKMLLSDYLDQMLDSVTMYAVETHVESCAQCRTVLDGFRNVVGLVKDARLIPMPTGFSSRLYSKIDELPRKMESVDDVPLGITGDTVPAGSHLIYFWQSNAEFEAAVKFLYPGLGKDEHCIIFGHDEALDHVQEVMSANGYDPARLIRDRKLTVLRRHAPAQQTIAEIGEAIERALADGARFVRFLGNLGIGLAPLPAGEDDVLELEAKATALMASLPCVVVCMYDVRTVPGRLLFKGGLETHNLSVCSEGVKVNPFCTSAHATDSHRVN